MRVWNLEIRAWFLAEALAFVIVPMNAAKNENHIRPPKVGIGD
jgi:hypothetical protein